MLHRYLAGVGKDEGVKELGFDDVGIVAEIDYHRQRMDGAYPFSSWRPPAFKPVGRGTGIRHKRGQLDLPALDPLPQAWVRRHRLRGRTVSSRCRC